MDDKKMKRACLFLGIFTVAALAIFLRFYNITGNGFFLYDEGYYLNHTRPLVTLVSSHKLATLEDYWKSFTVIGKFALATGKCLWFFLSDLRIIFGAATMWYYPKILSAIAGTLTLLFVYLFSKRYYNSKSIGLLSVLVLAFLPSHIFYSRLGIQEALSTMFFLLGFYFYFFPQRFSWKTFLSAFFFVCVYFTNYRQIVIPILIAVTEVFLWITTKEKLNFRKYVWHTLTFFFLIFMIGNLDKAQNTIIVFSWMFHQGHLAQGTSFDLVNFLTYPYLVFRLESILFGSLFFGNIYFLVKKQWSKAFPLLLICVVMGGFSLASEKGARYLAVTLPFMAMGVASLLAELYNLKHHRRWKVGVVGLSVLLIASYLPKSIKLVQAQSDYKPAVEYLVEKEGEDVKFLSTQSWVQNLYVKDKDNVLEAPHDFGYLLKRFSEGSYYLVIDPQSYISYTKSRERFDPQLEDYIGFINSSITPVKTFDHFNDAVLERFVFEHSSNLRESIRFLKRKNKDTGTIRIYDLKKSISVIIARLSQGRGKFKK